MSVYHSQPGLVSYPRMERQDLTQSQLGSFKFVPTDPTYCPTVVSADIDYLHDNTYFQPGQLQSTYLDARHRRTSPGRQRQQHYVRQEPRHPYSAYVNNMAQEYGAGLPLPQHILARDADNANMAPSLKVTSPTKYDHRLIRGLHAQYMDVSRSPIQPGLPRGLRDQSKTGGQSSAYSDSVFDPDNGMKELMQSSLLRALATEQDAHNITKADLLQLQARYAELEGKLENTEKQNRSLLGSVTMLKSLVQHNVKKEQCQAASTLANSQWGEADYRLPKNKPFGRAGLSGTEVGDHTLLHDAMERQRQKYGDGRPQEAEVHKEHDGKIWDFEAFEKVHGYKGTPHAIAKSNVVPSTESTPVYKHVSHDHNSMKTGPPQFPPIELVSSDQPHTKQSDIVKAVGARHEAVIKDGPYLLETKQHALEQEQLQALSLPPIPDIWAWRGQCALSGSFSDGSTPGSESKTNGDRGEVDRSAGPENLQIKASYTTAQNLFRGAWHLNTPYDPDIRWEVTVLNPIFENAADKEIHLGSAYKPEFKNTYFWQYPVRYTPSKGERNLYRTVMIDFIPPNINYFELVDVIRGGSLESIQLIEPIPRLTDFKTARVVFNYELGARALYMHGQSPGLYLNRQRLRVWQVLQPTYPRNKKLEHDIFEKSCTRLVIMDNITEDALMLLPRKLKSFIKDGSLIEIAQTAQGGLPVVEFNSVEAAVRAFDQLMQDSDFTGVDFDFEPDQCEDPYEEDQ